MSRGLAKRASKVEDGGSFASASRTRDVVSSPNSNASDGDSVFRLVPAWRDKIGLSEVRDVLIVTYGRRVLNGSSLTIGFITWIWLDTCFRDLSTPVSL